MWCMLFMPCFRTPVGQGDNSAQPSTRSPPFSSFPSQDTTTLNVAQMLARNNRIVSLGLSKHSLVDSSLDTLVT